MERASVSKADVEGIVKRLYDLDVTEQKTIESYYDVNTYVKVSLLSSTMHERKISPFGYVLKIINSVDSGRTDYVDAMIDVTDTLCKHGIVTSRNVKNVSGADYSMENLLSTSDSTCSFLVRLLEYIPGDTLTNEPITSDISYQVGQMAGRINLILKDYKHVGLDDRRSEWSTIAMPNLTELVHYVDNNENRALVKNVISEYVDSVAVNYCLLTPGVIHGDLNSANILLRTELTNADTSLERTTVNAVIDFGDVENTYVIFEVAIAMTYIMLDSKAIEPFEAAGHLLAGYLKEYDLPAVDLDILKECICARLAISLVHGEMNNKKNPLQFQYLDTATTGWSLTRQLFYLSKEEFKSRLQFILDRYEMYNIFQKK